ncbi:hypothetical protein [Pseudonocardia sp.]
MTTSTDMTTPSGAVLFPPANPVVTKAAASARARAPHKGNN